MTSVSPAADPGRPKPRWRWTKRLLIAFAFLALLVVGGHWYWGHHAEARFEAKIRQLREAGEPVAPADLAAPAVPDAQNAVLDLRAAAAAIDDKTAAWKQWDELDPLGFPLREEEITLFRQIIDEGRPAFGLVRQAAAKAGVDWRLRFESPIIISSLDTKDLNPQRKLSTLLGIAVLHAHHIGDDAEAIRLVRELLFISRAVDRQPSLIGHLVSIGIGAIAVERINQIAPDLRIDRGDASVDGVRAARPDDVKALIAELLDAGSQIEGQLRAIRGERVMELDTVRVVADGRMSIDARLHTDGANRAHRLAAYAMKPIYLTDGRLMADYADGVLAAASALDWQSCQARLPALPNEIKSKPFLHPLAKILVPSFGRALQHTYLSMANRRLAAVAIAARWYAIDHAGRLPERLEDLVPTYLPAVPTDPMAASRPLTYVPGGDNPIVYSYGENARDDKGYHPPPEASTPKTRENSDLVVHLKRQPRPPPSKKREPWE